MSSSFPPPGEPEILDSSGGPAQGPQRQNGGRRAALAAGGIIGGVVILGSAAWAVTWFLSSGADVAEVLPASTIAFAQVNLDPSGDQKIEALKTLNKFPAFEDELGLDATDDIRKSLFERIQKDGACPDVDYADDIEPWLGDRMAVAAVDAGEDNPSPVAVVEVTDQAKAEDGIDKLLACEEGPDAGAGGYVIADGWAVIAETDDIAESVVADAAKDTLADDADYQHWMDEAGADGIMSMYAAPAAGAELAEAMQGVMDLPGMEGMEDMPGGAGVTDMTDDQIEQLKDFKGAAVKLRFTDGAVEAEFAGEFAKTDLADAMTGDEGAAAVATLPENTAFALGGSLEPGWFDAVLDQVATIAGPDQDIDNIIAEAEAQTGLALPEDVETLTGEAFAIALSSDIDFEALSNSEDLSDFGIGMKVKGDPEAVETVLDKLRPQIPDESWLASETSGDFISFGPDQDWLAEMAGDGGLGDTDAYQDVIPEADRASTVLFANLDAGDDWLVNAVQDSGEPDDVIDNLRPLSAFGVSGWADGDTVHGFVKLTTD